MIAKERLGGGALKQWYVRRLHDLVHALGAQRALDQIAYCYGANESGETGILAFLFCGAVFEDLGWAEGRLRGSQLALLVGGGGQQQNAEREQKRIYIPS